MPVAGDGETLGEILFRGNVVMKGYHRDAASTEAAFAGGWFHSGDLAVRHPDGHLQIRDRLKDIIISGGENISSIEVEDALHHHPAVAAAAVVGWPDEKWGEVPAAFIELAEGVGAPSTEELIAFCRARLAHYKIPKRIVFTTLPRTSTGKIQKRLLRSRRSRRTRDAERGRYTAHAPDAPPAGEPVLLHSRADGVVTLTLNRPRQSNALSEDLLAALQAELDRLAQDAELRCVVLAATGKAFSAGHDLKQMRAPSRAGLLP